jgi:hypothetical protein
VSTPGDPWLIAEGDGWAAVMCLRCPWTGFTGRGDSRTVADLKAEHQQTDHSAPVDESEPWA